MKWFVKIISAFLISAVYFVSTAQDLSTSYLDKIARADSLIAKHDWTAAETEIMSAMRDNPANPLNVLLMSNVGMLRHYAGRDSSALAILDDAVRMAPNSVTVRSNRATVRLAAGYPQSALEDYNHILEVDSMIIEARRMKSLILLSDGKFQQLSHDMRFLLNHFPDEAATHEVVAMYEIEQGQYADAIPHLSKLIKINPLTVYLGERAKCYILTDQLNEASSDIAEALKTDPANAELYIYRAMLNKKRFRPQDATEDVKTAIGYGASLQAIRQAGL